MNDPADFFDLYRQGFARVAVAVPRCRVADPAFNAEQSVALLHEAASAGAALVVFPELGLSAYTCDDLFHQRALLDGCEAALARLVAASEGLDTVAVLGLPLRVDHSLFNCAVVAAPRPAARRRAQDLPAELRRVLRGAAVQPGRPCAGHASAAARPDRALRRRRCCSRPRTCRTSSSTSRSARTCGCRSRPRRTRRWAAPRCCSTCRRRTSPSASRPTGTRLAASQSARCLAAYLYSSAGPGRIDHRPGLGRPVADLRERPVAGRIGALCSDAHLITADVDLERLAQDRLRQTSFGQSAARHRRSAGALSHACAFTWTMPAGASRCGAASSASPMCRADRGTRDERCHEVYNIQVQGLAQRLSASGIEQARHRRLRRPRLDARAAGVRARDGPAGPAAHQHPRRDDAGLRHRHAHARPGACA